MTCRRLPGANNLPGEWHNSLKPAGKAGPVLTLAENGKSKYIIIVSAGATKPELKAAEQMLYWLEQMTAVKLPIASEDTISAKKKVISIGRTKLFEKSLPETATRKLANGGWGIAVKKTNLFLWGAKNRGTVNAVFAFLEEDIGCRWYTKKHTRIPKISTLKVAPVSRTYSPALKLRDPFYWVSWDWHWSLHNRTNAPDAAVPEEYGGRVDYGTGSSFGHMFVHTFDRLIAPDKYFDKHPEYFMLDEDGKRSKKQLCMTNPDVVRLMIKQVHKFLAECPHSEIVSVSKNDMVRVCLCERCKQLDDAEGTNMASLLNLVNSVAESIENQYPGVDVSTLAYLETIQLPKTVRPRKNVIIRLCNDSAGAWFRPFTPAEECDFAEILKKWSSIHDKIYIWDYIMNLSHFMAPMPNMNVIAKNIRFFVKNNAHGVMTQGNCQGPGSEREWLRSWVIAKLMLYPSMDVNELMDDFIFGHYGKAAGPIAQYNRLLREQGKKYKDVLDRPEDGIRYRMSNPFLSKAFLDKSSRLFDEAEKLAEDQAVLHRVQRERLPIMYVKLVRGPEFTGDEYGRVLQRFGKITRREKIVNLKEGAPDLEENLKKWQNQWQKKQTDPCSLH